MKTFPARREEDVTVDPVDEMGVFGEEFDLVLLEFDANETNFGIARVFNDDLVHRLGRNHDLGDCLDARLSGQTWRRPQRSPLDDLRRKSRT